MYQWRNNQDPGVQGPMDEERRFVENQRRDRFNGVVNKKHLLEILEKTQCPLAPQKVNNKLESLYYFNNEFWKKVGEDECEKINIWDMRVPTEKYKQKCKDESELMLCIDEYISTVRINKSCEINDKLKVALAEANGEDDGDDSNDMYQKLIPNAIGRLMFLIVIVMVIFNGYFLYIQVKAGLQGQYDSYFMNVIAIIVSLSETILFANILFGNVMYSVASFIYAMHTNDAIFSQCKTIAWALRDLSVLSMLRYMPSTEIITNAFVHSHQTLSKMAADFWLTFGSLQSDKKKSNWVKRILAVPMYVVELFAPILSFFALLIKVKQLSNQVLSRDIESWQFNHLVIFIAFINQVAGLRLLRNIETSSIQHFVFSGSDAELDKDELILMDKWWNVTILSAVSNLKLNWFDNMVFWFSLDPQKIQLLLKNHNTEHFGDRSLIQMVDEEDIILEHYDDKVKEKLERKAKRKEEKKRLKEIKEKEHPERQINITVYSD